MNEQLVKEILRVVIYSTDHETHELCWQALFQNRAINEQPAPTQAVSAR